MGCWHIGWSLCGSVCQKRELSLARISGFTISKVKQFGYTVIATASLRGFAHVKELGASQVFDYESTDIESELRSLGPFRFMMTASGDLAS